MTKRQGIALLLILALVGGALLLRSKDTAAVTAGARAGSKDLTRLRAAASLQACPAALARGLPSLRLPCLGGGPAVDTNGAPGRPQLINVWATWCPPCVREVPVLVAFAAEAGDRVGLVGVLLQDTPENGLEFARQFDMHYPSVVDEDGRILRTYGRFPPITLFVDAQGTVRHVERGEIGTTDELEQLVTDKLGVTL